MKLPHHWQYVLTVKWFYPWTSRLKAGKTGSFGSSLRMVHRIRTAGSFRRCLCNAKALPHTPPESVRANFSAVAQGERCGKKLCTLTSYRTSSIWQPPYTEEFPQPERLDTYQMLFAAYSRYWQNIIPFSRMSISLWICPSSRRQYVDHHAAQQCGFSRAIRSQRWVIPGFNTAFICWTAMTLPKSWTAVPVLHSYKSLSLPEYRVYNFCMLFHLPDHFISVLSLTPPSSRKLYRLLWLAYERILWSVWFGFRLYSSQCTHHAHDRPWTDAAVFLQS